MKKYLLLTHCIICTVLAGCAQPTTSTSDAGAPARWEYSIVQAALPLDQNWLEARGFEGWELVSAWPDPELKQEFADEETGATGLFAATLVFKRPL